MGIVQLRLQPKESKVVGEAERASVFPVHLLLATNDFYLGSGVDDDLNIVQLI